MRSLILFGVLLCLTACGEDETSSVREVVRSEVERSTDSRVVKLREDLDLLRENEAIQDLHALGDELSELAGVESYLLQARLLGMRGDLSSAHPLIEAARAAAPEDPRVYATAVELYAAQGQFDTATTELKEGLRVCGVTPELLRAQGILFLCIGKVDSPERGLEKLKAAMLADPDLPFTKRPLGQAYMLVARHELAEGKTDQALADIKASLEYDPSETDAWHFLAEVWSAAQEHEKAIGVLERLIEMEQPLEAELALTHKKAGTKSLITGDRPGALVHFMVAREMGLTDKELGFGAQALRDEAVVLVSEGLVALQESDLGSARLSFEHAIKYDPADLAARNHLGVTQFRMSDYSGAVDSWRTVLLDAGELEVQLPDPVHINLAKALMRLDDAEGALLALKDYLLDEPFGDFVDETRELVTLMQTE